jgi:hypothetical protein
MEKAYAKVCGSYELMEGGLICDGLVDMSGGIAETFKLNEIRASSVRSAERQKVLNEDAFWNVLLTAKRKSSVIGCNAKEAKVKLFKRESTLAHKDMYLAPCVIPRYTVIFFQEFSGENRLFSRNSYTHKFGIVL